MMRITIAIALALLTIGCESQKSKEATTDMLFFDKTEKDLPKLEAKDPHLAFGKIIEGDKVEHTYVLENVGKAPLLLNEVTTSCGCTVAKSWTREPIHPGDQTELIIVFDSTNKVGKIDKSISVYHNGNPSVTMLTLGGEVVAIE